MDASIIDLRYKMRDVLKDLERKEPVNILYHGKVKGTIFPCLSKTKSKLKDHPYFGMTADSKISVEEQMKQLRGGRYDDV